MSLQRERRASSDSGEISSSDNRIRRSLKKNNLRRSSHESVSSEPIASPSARSHASQVRLPSFLKRPLPRGTDAPVILLDDPRLRKRRKSGWGSVADALNARDNARDGLKGGEASTAYPRLLGRTLFAMRGFGCFDAHWGIGSYGKNFIELIRRIGSDNMEDLRLNQVKCKITNRIDTRFATLKFGSKKLVLKMRKIWRSVTFSKYRMRR